jgi:hypothetical protein
MNGGPRVLHFPDGGAEISQAGSSGVPGLGGSGGEGGAGAGGAGGTGGEAGAIAGVGGEAGAPDAGSGGEGGTDAGSGAGSGGDSGTGGAGSGSTDDTSFFIPDIPFSYDGPIIDPGLEVIAFTIREGLLGPEWLVALKNVGTIIICAIDLESLFFDAGGNQIGRAWGIVNTKEHRGVSGTGGLAFCLSPGQIGMHVDDGSLYDIDVSAIASMTWSVGGINLVDAVRSNDLVVTGLHLTTDDRGRNRISGTLTNHSDVPVDLPKSRSQNLLNCRRVCDLKRA